MDCRALTSHTSRQKISKIAKAVSIFIKLAKMSESLQMRYKLCKKKLLHLTWAVGIEKTFVPDESFLYPPEIIIKP